MEKLFDSDNLSIHYDQRRSLMVVFGKKESIKIPPEIGALSVVEVAKELVAKKPDFFFVNDEERTYIFSVEEQSWIGTTIAKAGAECGLKKMAFLKPKAFIQELSTEQAIDEAGDLTFEFKYVKSEDEAMKWFGLS